MVKVGERNEELRWSLRALSHLPHDRVWVAGYRPRFLAKNVGHVAVNQRPGRRYENSTANLLAACEHPEVSDEFIFMQDDVFVMRPMEEVPTLHRGPLSEVTDYYTQKGSVNYLRGMKETARMLEFLGIKDILSYELHAPMVLSKRLMAEAIRTSLSRPLFDTRCFHKRTFYGNRYQVGGEQTHDFKVFGRTQEWSEEWPFLSTTDRSFAKDPVGKHIQARFPEPSPYERREG